MGTDLRNQKSLEEDLNCFDFVHRVSTNCKWWTSNTVKENSKNTKKEESPCLPLYLRVWCEHLQLNARSRNSLECVLDCTTRVWCKCTITCTNVSFEISEKIPLVHL